MPEDVDVSALSKDIQDLNTSVIKLADYIKNRDIANAEATEEEIPPEQDIVLALESISETQTEIDDQKHAELISYQGEILTKFDTLEGLMHDELEVQSDMVNKDDFNAYSDVVVGGFEQLGVHTTPSDFENQRESVGYYADLGIIIFVFAVIPVFIAYRLIRPFGELINQIF